MFQYVFKHVSESWVHLRSADHQLPFHSGKLVTCIRFLMASSCLYVKYSISGWTTVLKERSLIDLVFYFHKYTSD